MENSNRTPSAKKKQNEWHDHFEEDKYLAMEQSGPSYTVEGHHLSNSDNLIDGREPDKWKANQQNTRNADAFSQDDYILEDNIDLDEDQNISLSNEDGDR